MHPCCGPNGGSYIVSSDSTKTKNPKKTQKCRQKKDKMFRRARKASNIRVHWDYIAGVGIFGLLPTVILGEINDSLCSAIYRYTLTRSVPELYNSVGRGGIAALKQEVDLECHKTWLAWDQARRDKAVANATHKKSKEKDN